MVIAFIVIVAVYLYWVNKHEDHSLEAAKKWKPYFAEGWSEPPDWVLDRLEEEREEKRKQAEYERTHFYDRWYRCWVEERPDGTYVREDNGEPIEPVDLLDRYEYIDYMRHLEEGLYDSEEPEEDPVVEDPVDEPVMEEATGENKPEETDEDKINNIMRNWQF